MSLSREIGIRDSRRLLLIQHDLNQIKCTQKYKCLTQITEAGLSAFSRTMDHIAGFEKLPRCAQQAKNIQAACECELTYSVARRVESLELKYVGLGHLVWAAETTRVLVQDDARLVVAIRSDHAPLQTARTPVETNAVQAALICSLATALVLIMALLLVAATNHGVLLKLAIWLA